jgi:hypothetical protein
MNKNYLFIAASFAFLLFVGQVSSQDHLWTFDEGSGTISYDQGNSRNSVNAVLNNAQWRDLSKVGPGAAVHITGGDNSYVSFGNNNGWSGNNLRGGNNDNNNRRLGDDDSNGSNNGGFGDNNNRGPGDNENDGNNFPGGNNNNNNNNGNTVGQFGTQAFTVAFWFQTTDTSLSLADLVGNRAASGHGNFFSVRLSSDGYVSAEVDQDASGTNYIGIRSSQGGLNDGNWHQVVVTRSGNTLILYVDGSVSNSGTGSGTTNINNGVVFKIGRSLVDSNTYRFALDSVFDDLAIYSSALSAYQVNALYQGATNQ